MLVGSPWKELIIAAKAIGVGLGTYPWLRLHFGYVSGALLDCRFDRNRVARCAEIRSESQRNSGTDTGESSVDRLDGRRPEARPCTSSASGALA